MTAIGAVMFKEQGYAIANFNNVKKRVDDLKHRSDDVKSRLGGILKKLWNPERTIRSVPSTTDFKDLRYRFPQFAEVIDFYESSVIIFAQLDQHFQIPPVLLQGDPGLGKTYFSSELAKLLALPFYEISLATTSSSFSLSGGNIQWSEGSPGFIANTLAESAVANPVILIDEIDKASQESRYNPLNVFYGLLESHSAKRFRDEALEFELDASKIIWIATANYMQFIPEPIQSRMRAFQIKQPDPSRMLSVIESIYSQVVHSNAYGKLLDEALSETVIDYLATQSPRKIKLAIEEGAFKAIRNGRRTIQMVDLPAMSKEEHRVGFI